MTCEIFPDMHLWQKSARMKSIALLLLLFISYIAQGQQAANNNVSLKVLNESGTAVEGATAELRKASDSTLVKTAITDQSGMAIFERVRSGIYRIRISMVHATPLITAAFELKDKNITLPAVT